MARISHTGVRNAGWRHGVIGVPRRLAVVPFLKWQNTLNNEIRIATNDNFVLGDKRFQGEIARWDDRRWSAPQGGPSGQTPLRTGSHKIAQYICLTARCGSIIGEMVVSNCARRPAGRIFVSRTIRAASIRAVRRDQRAGLMHHQSPTDSCCLINIRRHIEFDGRGTTRRSEPFWPKRTHRGAPRVEWLGHLPASKIGRIAERNCNWSHGHIAARHLRDSRFPHAGYKPEPNFGPYAGANTEAADPPRSARLERAAATSRVIQGSKCVRSYRSAQPGGSGL